VGVVENPTSLADFCRTEYPRLVGLLALYVGSRPTAEDLAQEALVRLYRHWPEVQTMTSPHAWLCGVGLNLSRSWWRRRYAERRALGRYDAGRPTSAVEEPADVLAVRAAVAQLPPRQRAALVLRYYGGLSVTETAAHMGCAPGTVKSLTNRAITTLRSSFELAEEPLHA
jgi:RNA polymerase sigma-70 factor (sigma-E family)